MAIFFIRKNFELTSNVTYPCRSREVVMHTYLPKKKFRLHPNLNLVNPSSLLLNSFDIVNK